MDTPSCECHGEPMLWNKKKRYPSGGTWVCRIRNREQQRRYYWRDPEKKRAYSQAMYDSHALTRLMRQQLTRHRKRLAELQEQLNGSLQG